MIDWSGMLKVRKPNRKERRLYRQWFKYLSEGNKLSEETIHARAAQAAERRMSVPKD
jgi:hypothetical protein